MSSKILNTLTKFGIGVALLGGAANSMLYNGKNIDSIYIDYNYILSTSKKKIFID